MTTEERLRRLEQFQQATIGEFRTMRSGRRRAQAQARVEERAGDEALLRASGPAGTAVGVGGANVTIPALADPGASRARFDVGYDDASSAELYSTNMLVDPDLSTILPNGRVTIGTSWTSLGRQWEARKVVLSGDSPTVVARRTHSRRRMEGHIYRSDIVVFDTLWTTGETGSVRVKLRPKLATPAPPHIDWPWVVGAAHVYVDKKIRAWTNLDEEAAIAYIALFRKSDDTTDLETGDEIELDELSDDRMEGQIYCGSDDTAGRTWWQLRIDLTKSTASGEGGIAVAVAEPQLNYSYQEAPMPWDNLGGFGVNGGGGANPPQPPSEGGGDPGPGQGGGGGGGGGAFFLVDDWDRTESDLGEIPLGTASGAPMPGGNSYTSTRWETDGGTAYAEQAAGSVSFDSFTLYGTEYDTDGNVVTQEQWLPIEGPFAIRMPVKVSVLGDVSDSGVRNLSLSWLTNQWERGLEMTVLYIYFGDSAHAVGEASLQNGVDAADTATLGLLADTYYTLLLDCRDGLRVKWWRTDGLEPTSYDLEQANYGFDDSAIQAYLSVAARIGNPSGAAQRVTLQPYHMALPLVPGMESDRLLIGYADGATSSFRSAVETTPAGLKVFVDDQPTPVVSYDPATRLFVLDRAPSFASRITHTVIPV